MLSTRDVHADTLIKRAPQKELELGYWNKLRAGDRESAFYLHLAPAMKHNRSILQASKIELDPFAIHLPHLATSVCLGRGSAMGEPLAVVSSVALCLGALHRDLCIAYSDVRVSTGRSQAIRDLLKDKCMWEMARENFPKGVKTVQQEIFKDDSMTYEEAMSLMFDQHGAGHALQHGDIWGNNVLLKENDQVVFIDWQLLHKGDPLLDLGMLVGLTLQKDDMTVENVHSIIHSYCKGIGEDLDEKSLEVILGKDGTDIDKLLERMRRCFHAWCCLNCSFAPVEEYFPHGDDAAILKKRFSAFLDLKKLC